MTRTMKLAATAVLGLSIALSAAACGDEQEAPNAESSTTVATPPSDRSVPVVPGPKPRSSTPPTSESPETATGDGQSCGSAKGPDGALQIRVVEGDVSCETATGIAKEYSPLIATGQPQDVNGWDCGPSTTAGELARCTKDSQAFAFVP
ncbi:hypothetical protein [Gordonia liuliyuniae]|uniref:Secreted protein n=1 Tax=Gordonia liuliyuniae TaxID=2911517 RepID=A0ABS9IPD0_9ACTN|nr:hypothetical protein [Gordonia liuliyuniae]MCF8587413.1 hypothetical protein [Gordonia liuliyuniae]